MMNNLIKPEKLYPRIFKTGIVIGVVATFISSLVIITILNGLDIKVSYLWAIVVLVVAVTGGYFRYWFNQKIFIGRTMKEGNPREIKQAVYIIFPFIFLLILILSSTLIEEEGIIGYTATIVIFLGMWGLFFWRLKNTEKEKDVSSILNKTEIIAIIVFTLVVGGIIYFIYKNSGW